jgi:hypothetical protein
MRVDHATGVVVVLEVEMPGQRIVRTGAEGGGAGAVEVDDLLAAAHAVELAIGSEQAANRVEVAVIDGHAVARHQLAKLLAVVDTAHHAQQRLQVGGGGFHAVSEGCVMCQCRTGWAKIKSVSMHLHEETLS